MSLLRARLCAPTNSKPSDTLKRRHFDKKLQMRKNHLNVYVGLLLLLIYKDFLYVVLRRDRKTNYSNVKPVIMVMRSSNLNNEHT